MLWFWKRVVGGEQGAVGTGPAAWDVSWSMDHQTQGCTNWEREADGRDEGRDVCGDRRDTWEQTKALYLKFLLKLCIMTRVPGIEPLLNIKELALSPYKQLKREMIL